ncbi:MAG: MFS transporter [Eubacteriales bacterium]
MEEKKKKRQYPLNAKNMFGLSTMRWTTVVGSSLMTSAFTIYLTDYSKMANAAVVSTVLLAFGRVLDAVDDPLQGFIMDRSPVTRIGKYKPFFLGGIALTTLALLMMFNIPVNVAEWIKIVLLALGYIFYEVGVSFQPDYAIKATMTNDPKVREKLLVTPRIFEQIIAVPFSFYLSIALVFGSMFNGDNHKGFSLATLIFVLPIALVAFVGALCIKEGPYVSQSEERIGIKDVIAMFKANKPLWISQLSGLIGGCVFTFVVAAVPYYVKWAYGPENFGTYSAVWGAAILLGIIAGTVLAPRLLKKLIPVTGAIFCNLAQATPLALIFILGFFIKLPPAFFFALIFIMMVFSGMSYIPGSLMNMECMDYNRWKLGKGMQGMVQAVGSFIGKAQVALAGLATGVVLIAVKYDAALYESEEFIASGGTIPPELLKGLELVFCIIPVVLSIATALILLAYPLKKDKRELMYAELSESDTEKNELAVQGTKRN